MVLDWNAAGQVAKQARERGLTVAFTNGCFDVLHAGHIAYLGEAKKLADILIVGLNSDASVKRLKGESRPINIEEDRATVLDALKPVDLVVQFTEDTPKDLIELIAPDVLVKGGDYREEDIVGADFVKSRGGRVVVIPFLAGRSSTSIINKMSGI